MSRGHLDVTAGNCDHHAGINTKAALGGLSTRPPRWSLFPASTWQAFLPGLHATLHFPPSNWPASTQHYTVSSLKTAFPWPQLSASLRSLYGNLSSPRHERCPFSTSTPTSLPSPGVGGLSPRPPRQPLLPTCFFASSVRKFYPPSLYEQSIGYLMKQTDFFFLLRGVKFFQASSGRNPCCMGLSPPWNTVPHSQDQPYTSLAP